MTLLNQSDWVRKHNSYDSARVQQDIKRQILKKKLVYIILKLIKF